MGRIRDYFDAKLPFPTSLWRTYLSYKHSQRRFLRWLCQTIYDKKIDLSSPAAQAAAAEADSIGKGKGKADDAAKRKNAARSRLAVNEMRRAAEELAKEDPGSVVPREVMETLEKVIAGRTAVTEFYRTASASRQLNGDRDESTRKHIYMLHALMYVRGLLATCGIHAPAAAPGERSVMSREERLADDERVEVEAVRAYEATLAGFGQLRLSVLPASGIEDSEYAAPRATPAPPKAQTKEEEIDDFLPDHMKKGKAKAKKTNKKKGGKKARAEEVEEDESTPTPEVPQPPPVSLPLSDFVFEEESEGGDAQDLAVACWCFLMDCNALSEYVEIQWQLYEARKIPLMTASILTTKAAEMIRELEYDFHARFSTHLLAQVGSTDHAAIIKVLLSWDKSLDRAELHDLIPFTTAAFRQFIRFLPWDAMFKFAKVIVPGQAPLPREDVISPVFSPETQEALGWTPEIREDYRALFTTLGESAVQIMMSVPRTRFIWDAAFIGLVREYVQAPRHPISTSLVYEADFHLSAIRATAKNPHRAAASAIAFQQEALRTLKQWINHPFVYDPLTMAGVKNGPSHYVAVVESQLVPDTIGAGTLREMRQRCGDTRVVAKHHDLRSAPWMAGEMASSILLTVHQIGANTMNGSGHVTVLMQVYNALLVYRSFRSIPFLDNLHKRCASIMYGKAKIPARGELLIANLSNIQGTRHGPNATPAGGGRGLFQHDDAGSVLIRLLCIEPDKKARPGRGSAIAKMNDILAAREAEQGKPKRPKREAAEMLGALSDLSELCKAELEDGLLHVDTAKMELVALEIHRRWTELSEPLLLASVGPKWREHESQRTFQIGFVLAGLEGGLEHFQRKVGTVGKVTPEVCLQILDLAAQAFDEIIPQSAVEALSYKHALL